MNFKLKLLNRMLYLSLIVLIVFAKVSCRKIDSVTEPIDENKALASQFFHAHKTENPLIQKIIGYFESLNKKTGIAGKIAANYGTPYWDKSLLHQNNSFLTTAKGTVDNSYVVVYIPLLQSYDTTVKSQLTVKMTSNDTIYEIISEVEYANFGFLPIDTSVLNGLKVFTLFAKHNQNVFGYRRFKILDNRILQGQTVFTVNSNKQYIMELDSLPTNISGRTLSLAAPLPSSSCMQVYELQNAGYTVVYTMVGDVCVISSYGLGDDFGDGGGSTGGGGGSSGGGSTGWEPFTPTFDINNPCNVVDSLMKTQNFPIYYQYLRAAVTHNYESGYLFKNPFDNINTIHDSVAGPPGTLSISMSPAVPIDGALHNHYNDSLRLPVFSFDDFYQLYNWYENEKIDDTRIFTFGMVSDSTAYIIMITDSIAFETFGFNFLNDAEKCKLFKKVFYDGYGINEKKSIAENEKAFLKALQGLGAGISVFKAAPDLSSFGRIHVNQYDQVRPYPCN